MRNLKSLNIPYKLSLFLLLSFIILCPNAGKAQDFQYSLYHFTPLNVNPALAGTDNALDASLIYRRQSIGNEGGLHATQLNLTHPIIRGSRLGGIGFVLSDDRAGENYFFRRQNLTTALAYNLDLSPTQSFSFGISGGLEIRSIANDSWRTGSQWSGSRYMSSLPSGEELNNLKQTTFNFNAGLHYSAKNENGKEKSYFGISVFHLNQPGETFIIKEKLPSTFLLHTGITVWQRDNISLMPQLLWTNRSGHNFLNIGGKLSYGLDQVNTDFINSDGSIDVGISYVNDKAAVIALTLNQPGYNIGFSYDVDINAQSETRAFKGAPEIALRIFKELKVSPVNKKKKKKTPKKKPVKKKKKRKSTTKKPVRATAKAKPTGTTKEKSETTYPAKVNPVIPVAPAFPDSVGTAIALKPKVKAKPDLRIFKNLILHFDFNEALVEKSEERIILDNLATFLQENPDLTIRIVGHSDNIGKEEANIKLSFLRAQTIANYLLSKGISGDRLIVEGRGAFNPVVPNNSLPNRANNRRVEIIPELTELP